MIAIGSMAAARPPRRPSTGDKLRFGSPPLPSCCKWQGSGVDPDMLAAQPKEMDGNSIGEDKGCQIRQLSSGRPGPETGGFSIGAREKAL